MRLQDAAEKLFRIAPIAVFIHVLNRAAITAGIMELCIAINTLESGYVSRVKLPAQKPDAMLRPDQEVITVQRMNARRGIATAGMRPAASIVQVILLTAGGNHRGVPHHPVAELRLVPQVEDPVALPPGSMIHIMFTTIPVHRTSRMTNTKSSMIMKMTTRMKTKPMMPRKIIGENIINDCEKAPAKAPFLRPKP